MKELNNPNSAHSLHNLVLAQWYLFELETIDLNAPATLLSGENGAGKTTIFDAIQFVLMGGDQRKTRYNSASDGKTSGRSARSYALGDFKENDTNSCQRENANTYIFLNWYDDHQRPYSFGLSVYANSQSPNVETRGHIIKGRHIIEADLLLGDDTFLPWREFVERMKLTTKEHRGAVSYEILDSARMIREKISEVMSLNQTRSAKIEPDLLVKTLSNALQLKMDSPIDLFIRDFILPPDPIETEQLRQDLIVHQHIEEDIARAESHKVEREALIAETKKITKHRTTAHHALWVSQEAEAVRLDEDLGHKQDAQDAAQERLGKAQRTIGRETPRQPKLKQCRDDALIAWKNSDAASLSKTVETAKQTVSHSRTNLTKAIRSLQKAVGEVIRQQFPDTLGIQSFELLAKHWNACTHALGQTGVDSLSTSESVNTFKVTEEVKGTKMLLTEMTERVEAADKDVSRALADIKTQGEALQGRIDRLKQGLSDINPATSMTIELLKREGIQSIPVCDLCEITDRDWQEAVESYLGSNREALVVSVHDFDHALEVYETGQMREPRIKRARMINPDHALRVSKEPTKRMVSTLIDTSDSIARGFMNIVLDRTKMATTRDELRKERKALMASGLTTGGGTVGGTARIEGLLIGKHAKAQQRERLEAELDVLAQRLASFSSPATMLSQLNRQWAGLSASIVEGSVSVQEQNVGLVADEKALSIAQEQLKPLTSEDERLKDAKDQAEKDYAECSKAITQAESDQTHASEILKKLSVEIERLSTMRDEAEQIRSETEKLPQHDAAKSDEFWQTYEQKFEGKEGIYSLIRNEAQGNAQSTREKELRARGELREKVVRFTTHFSEDIANRQELLEAARLENENTEAYHFIETDCTDWVERILAVQLLEHRQAAQEAAEQMEKNFRGIIVGELQSRFEQMKYTFNQLNNLLKKTPFHDNIYSFHYKALETESLNTIYEYITTASKEETELVGTMFETASDHPAIDLLKEALISGDDLINEIRDYRSFFTYDMKMRNPEMGGERRVADMQHTGSGGEQQTPAYIALAASFMNVYKIRDHSSRGACLVLLDEAFNNMDGGNASAAVSFLKKTGLQLLIAAPPEVTLKIGKEMDQIYTICREDRDVVIDHTKIFEEGQALIDQRNPIYHPDLVTERAAELKAKAEVVE
ncbi:SbcC/MukB-like Walker B domain-containing protein [Vibrio crassostreae]|uniref:SbcC/MukB-like Walker B domain-containing protein n=1 Tax=Vibrio crassostreae TaxID=246167 RepID=UPI001B315146|nr:SbcC/MukB-like Walker B domain-containing protein [Vibrio crassostreae]CAK1756606.1 AAA family ATPase [Vibrio crassostreae]CAK2547163.1 AAA family ATPase [Vibrio crassostreae]CAK3298361.1 AAA family ATPase [Vibrio crassostreae]